MNGREYALRSVLLFSKSNELFPCTSFFHNFVIFSKVAYVYKFRVDVTDDSA